MVNLVLDNLGDQTFKVLFVAPGLAVKPTHPDFSVAHSFAIHVRAANAALPRGNPFGGVADDLWVNKRQGQLWRIGTGGCRLQAEYGKG